MRILVIPDVHLKPRMFDRASELLEENKADRAVCLMDIADDWHQQFNLDLYIRTYDAAIAFAGKYPDTLWCYGNHDVCYLWNQRESGYSKIAPWTVCEKLRLLKETLPDERQLAYIHRIDHVLFSHAGLADEFVRSHVPADKYDDVDSVIKTINGFECGQMWQDLSPIWLRPQYYRGKLYKSEEFLQLAGHTPVERITRRGSLVSCDVFSTYDTGEVIGTQEFPVIDTVSRECQGFR
ncbi:MAG: metallophosphoesterase [Eubacterium sp.]|nr:metallophosphoesterase [Eubacterium sp.]